MKPWVLLFIVFVSLCLPAAAAPANPQAELRLQGPATYSGVVDDPAGRGIGVNFRFWAFYLHDSPPNGPASADYSIPVPGGTTVTGSLSFAPNPNNDFRDIFIPVPYSQLIAHPTFTATITNAVNLRLAEPYTVTAQTGFPLFMRSFTVTGGTVTEGNTGTTSLTFTVALNAPINEDVTFRYITGAGSATAGTDYTPVTGTGTIPAGSRTITIDVPVKGDLLEEADETVSLDISEISVPVNRFFFPDTPGKIVNDDTAVNAVPAATVVTEAPGTDTVKAWFAVNLASVKAVPVTVRVSTRDGTALAGSDYRALAPTEITIPAGDLRAWVAITVTATPQDEDTEQFFLDVEDPGSGGVVSAPCTIQRFAVTGISQTAAGAFTLTFTTGIGQRYYIEEAPTPGAEWTLITNALTGTGLPVSQQVPSSSQGRGFFRVHTYAPLPPGTPAAGS